ncbi:MAG TPA: gamma-glutamylcyclotransferase [Devosia sp.]|nr:gamma-glutamylcyclotransferase [Devosia sp.]
MPRPKESQSLTPELVALIERTEPDPGPEPGRHDPSDAEFAAMAAHVLAGAPAGELWLFAYGSLIWNPGHDFVEHRRATAAGWHRSFCLKLTRWRGTREMPALMMALDRGGSCTGLAYRLPPGDRLKQIERLLRRETDGLPATNVARWINVTVGHENIRALAFVASRSGVAYAGRQSPARVAHVLARAAGHWGSAAAYLERTVAKLDEHGIRDRNLWTLQRLVAEEIRQLAPSR